MDNVRRISEVVRLPVATDETALPRPSTAESLRLSFEKLPARLDDEQLAMVEQVASSPLPDLPACGEAYFLKCIRTMQAALPRRQADELSGNLVTSAYQRMLGAQPRQAISYLTERALSDCQWFPTINECKAMLTDWNRDDVHTQIRELARDRAASEHASRQWELQARFDEVMSRLAKGTVPQAEIDALPAQWKAVGETRSHLWRHPDGRYTPRGNGHPNPFATDL